MRNLMMGKVMPVFFDEDLQEEYRPSESEEYMGEKQLNYFRSKLMKWRIDLLNESQETVEHLKHGHLNNPDTVDSATAETNMHLELRTKGRYRKLIDKIDAALGRIKNGTYGYCEETGDPIGIKRLCARPIATLSIEAQEKHERFENTHSEEEDDDE